MTMSKLETGIPGFELLSRGGLPEGRATLLAGTTGSGKTIFAVQFLGEGAKRGEPGVLVNFEERPEDVRRNARSYADIARWEKEGLWAFVDASPQASEVDSGDYDLDALVARIEHAVKTVGAKRVALDPLGVLLMRYSQKTAVRDGVYAIITKLRALDVTFVITAQRNEDYGPITQSSVEEFAADNVILLRNALENEKRRRSIEIVKFRGADHQKGEFPFTITKDGGVDIIADAALDVSYPSSDERASLGSEALDTMMGGGLFREAVALVSGATGTGKTLLVVTFVAGGLAAGERCLVFAQEESREQFLRNARNWGMDLEPAEQDGRLRVIARYPETAALEDHLSEMKRTIEAFRPDRVAVDGLTAFERIAAPRGFNAFLISLIALIKHNRLLGLLTSSTPALVDTPSRTEARISTLTDALIVLRYVEMAGETRRVLAVLKQRGGEHDKAVREFTIDGSGLHIGTPFYGLTGVLFGPTRPAGPAYEVGPGAGPQTDGGRQTAGGSEPDDS